jgi:hypothetical protein
VVGDKSWLLYGWDFAGTKLYGVKRTANGSTVLASLDVARGAEKIIGQLQLPPYSALSCFSLSRDEKGFLTSINHPIADL